MKTLNYIAFLVIIFITSCNSDTVEISQEEYEKLKGIKHIKPEYPKNIIWYNFRNDKKKASIVLMDNHEIIVGNDESNQYYVLHRPECKICIAKQDSLFNVLINEIRK